MEPKLNIVVGPSTTVTPAPAPPSARSDANALQNQQPDLRLVIEADPAAAGGYLYKTIDRRTGDVVQVLPRDEVAALSEAPGYASGSVVRTRA